MKQAKRVKRGERPYVNDLLKTHMCDRCTHTEYTHPRIRIWFHFKSILINIYFSCVLLSFVPLLSLHWLADTRKVNTVPGDNVLWSCFSYECSSVCSSSKCLMTVHTMILIKKKGSDALTTQRCNILQFSLNLIRHFFVISFSQYLRFCLLMQKKTQSKL